MKRYVLHPGYVISRNDGDRHYIDASRLARLYGLSIRASDVVTADSRGYKERAGDVHLFPKYDGNYVLPEPPPEAQS